MKCFEHVTKSLVIVMALCAGTALRAATLQLTCSPSDVDGSEVCAVQLSGVIGPGDAEQIDVAVHQAATQNASRFVRWLVLDSPGGDVLEAMRVAAVVRNRLLWTSNLNIVRHRYGTQEENEQRGHLCASSCFLVLIAGANRILISDPDANARVGLHRPYFPKESFTGISVGEAATRQQSAEEAVRAFARRERVPDALITEMMQRSSTQVYWLTRKDLLGLSGYAAWFEEMKTVQCGWDKEYEQAAFERLDRSGGDQARKLKTELAAYLGRMGSCDVDVIRKAQRAASGPAPRARKRGG